MKVLHGKQGKTRRKFVNLICLLLIIGFFVLSFLTYSLVQNPSLLLMQLGMGVLAVIGWLFLIVFINKETIVTRDGVEERLFFGKIPHRKFLWSDFIYVGEISLMNDREQIHKAYICTKEMPKPIEESTAYKFDYKKSVTIDYLDENRQILAPYFKGHI